MTYNTQNQNDTIENFYGTTIQHGLFNDRIYLMKIGDVRPEILLPRLLKFAQSNGYSKIFAKVPTSHETLFMNTGFTVEARIEKFYTDHQGASFLGYYLDKKREVESNSSKLNEIRDLALQYVSRNNPIKECDNFTFRKCCEDDVEIMARIYAEVFPTYPFPVDSPAYLLETMKTHVSYYCAETKGRMVALSSSEKDQADKNVEMTDFATLPDFRGNGLAVRLLDVMEAAMRKEQYITAYTIARAISPGMNITFAKLGYSYQGRLKNNTNISGNIESMNVWSKKL